MTQDLRSGDRAARPFFRSATFRSFFFGSRHVRLIAWGGAIALGVIAVVNAVAAYYLATLGRVVGDLVQKGGSYEQVSAFVLPFVGLYVLLFVIEPKSELIKNYYIVFWAKVSSTWFSDSWIMDYKRTFNGDAPDGLSQIIVDRPFLIAHNLVHLFVPLCRSVAILALFGHMTYSLSADLSPWLSRYLPGWLLYFVVLWSTLEGVFAYKLGRPLPGLLDLSYTLRAHFRSDIEANEARMKDLNSLSITERVKQRDIAREHLNAWQSTYLRTFRPNLKLLGWKSMNQQGWQFVLVAVLPLLVASGFFSLGVAGATVYAINEMRGALLTLPNQWPTVVDTQAQMIGVDKLEDNFATASEFPLPDAYLAPAE